MQGSSPSCRSTISWVIPVVLLCAVLVQPVVRPAHAESDDVSSKDEVLTLEEVRKIISERGYSWTAGGTSLS